MRFPTPDGLGIMTPIKPSSPTPSNSSATPVMARRLRIEKPDHNVQYCSNINACQLVNKPFFRNLSPIDNDTYEVELCKKMIKPNLPSSIGFYVNAKLWILQFYDDKQ